MIKTSERLQKIVSLIEGTGFASVKELSRYFQVSEMTIRRDLNKLAEEERIIRTFGGCAPIPATTDRISPEPQFIQDDEGAISLFCKADVLVTTLFNPKFDPIIFESGGKPKYPIVSESISHEQSLTCVGIDNYSAGFELGKWAGEYSLKHFSGKADVLDLGYHLPNTEERSRGFLDGLAKTLPEISSIMSLNPQSRFDLAYQLTQDALEVNNDINIIFAINDTNACGAIQACIDLNVDPDDIIIISFGLEGDKIKNAIHDGLYCKVSLAMFPEIVGRYCVDAAIRAYRSGDLPEKIETPYTLLTKETLTDFYRLNETRWELQWEQVQKRLKLPVIPENTKSQVGLPLPNCIGVLIPFPEHEWYQNLVASMSKYASESNINIQVLDAEQTLKDELLSAKRRIAKRAALEIQPYDTVFIGGGIITQFLTEYVHNDANVTVVTNATNIFKSLETKPNLTLISTGGVLRRISQSLVGPLAEKALQDIRVDKLFLTVSGVSFEFGLSQTEISELTIKQAMIKAAREVILLADHTQFEQESFIHVAPINVVDKLITDSGLPSHIRLQFGSAGIEVITC